MAMTQERADEIAYLRCIREVIKYCDLKGINEITASEELFKSRVTEEFAEDIANILHLEKEEAIEFTKFVFSDVVKALAKRKKEAIVRIHELLGKESGRGRTILGSEVGTEINREIIKKRVGFTYGK